MYVFMIKIEDTLMQDVKDKVGTKDPETAIDRALSKCFPGKIGTLNVMLISEVEE